MIVRLNRYLNHKKDSSSICIVEKFSVFHQLKEVINEYIEKQGSQDRVFGELLERSVSRC